MNTKLKTFALGLTCILVVQTVYAQYSQGPGNRPMMEASPWPSPVSPQMPAPGPIPPMPSPAPMPPPSFASPQGGWQPNQNSNFKPTGEITIHKTGTTEREQAIIERWIKVMFNKTVMWRE